MSKYVTRILYEGNTTRELKTDKINKNQAIFWYFKIKKCKYLRNSVDNR